MFWPRPNKFEMAHYQLRRIWPVFLREKVSVRPKLAKAKNKRWLVIQPWIIQATIPFMKICRQPKHYRKELSMHWKQKVFIMMICDEPAKTLNQDLPTSGMKGQNYWYKKHIRPLRMESVCGNPGKSISFPLTNC